MLFTDANREQLNLDGYTKVEGVILQRLLTAVLGSLKNVSSVDYDNPTTWYTLPVEYPGVIPSHHHQSQWDIRQHPRLHQVFAEFWRTDLLWVTMDRIGFIPPLRPYEAEECSLHWDMNPRNEPWFQAIVYLTDVDIQRAPFGAAPAVFRNLQGWLERNVKDLAFQSADFSSEEFIGVPGKAGDLIIWDSRLPHGPKPNHSTLPRVMQAVSMFPPSRANWPRADQIEWWRTKRAPPWWRDVPGQKDPEPGEPALLTKHGQRLIGLNHEILNCIESDKLEAARSSS